MQFPYILLPGRTDKVKTPIVPIGVSFGGRKYQIMCLLDSGADRSYLSEDFASVLGIEEVENTEALTMTGITGDPITTYFHKVSFTIGGHSNEEWFGFGKLGMPFGILGRTFFAHYIICFDERRQRVEFKESRS